MSWRLLYSRLLRAFGPQGWWPAQSPFEMMVGAILTQATNWRNVERAIERLRAVKGLHPKRLVALSSRRLERTIRPAGFFRQKAKRLKRVAQWYVNRYDGRPHRMFKTPWSRLRGELLAIEGIGPETADSILLYAGQQPVFVVDAYTTRVFLRHHLIGPGATYDETQRVVMGRGHRATRVYNEFHALLVAVGKRFCHRRHPECTHCPLGELPHTATEV